MFERKMDMNTIFLVFIGNGNEFNISSFYRYIDAKQTTVTMLRSDDIRTAFTVISLSFLVCKRFSSLCLN